MNDPLQNLDVETEIAQANQRGPIDISNVNMPLDMTVRSVALTIAQRHCGDTVVKEGNLYQHLKMDNKLGGPLTAEHVIRCALIFEMYLWGKWSQDIAGKAMEAVMDEMEEAIKRGDLDTERPVKDMLEEPPTRPHGGGE